MIKNERQYRVTKAQTQKFEQALAQLQQSETARQENLVLWELQTQALASQLQDLQAELEEYEHLTTGSPQQPIPFSLTSLRESTFSLN